MIVFFSSNFAFSRSPWNHTWTSRKHWTKGRKRIPGSQRWKRYVSTEQSRQEWHAGGKSKRFLMPTGEPGRPGLPGLPGSYTVQVPHNVQKREAGVCVCVCVYFAQQNPLRKRPELKRTRHWALSFVFSVSFRRWTGRSPQEGSPSSWQRLTAWNTTGSSHISFFFFFLVSFSGSAVAKLASSNRSP